MKEKTGTLSQDHQILLPAIVITVFILFALEF